MKTLTEDFMHECVEMLQEAVALNYEGVKPIIDHYCHYLRASGYSHSLQAWAGVEVLIGVLHWRNVQMVLLSAHWGNEEPDGSHKSSQWWDYGRSELRRRKRGRRTGVARRARRRRYRSVLPSIIMGNVRSLPNKMNELAVLTRHQWEYRECSLLLFTETWLTELTPDTATQLGGFTLLRADRSKESAVSRLQTQHPDILLLISGDFNHASPSSSLPNPVYKPLVRMQTAVTRTVKKWSEEAEEALKDCFNTTLWDVFSDAHGEDIDNLTHCITDYINVCVENTVPTRTVRSFSNSKPWITPDIKVLLKEKKRGFVSGDKEELKSVQRELRRKIRQEKDNYRRKMENQLQQNNICGVWKGLKTISGFKEQKSQPVGDRGWANDLNLFFNRFDQDFVDWSLRNNLQINAGKTKEVVVDFRRRNNPPPAPVNILGTDVDVVESYKYLGEAEGPLLRTFYDSVVGSAIFYGMVCWSSSITDRDRKRMDRLVRRASSVLGCLLDSMEVVGNGRMMAKLSSMLNNTSHPLQDTLTALGSSFSEWLLHPRCVKE
ncbi:hypothetical protein D4764_14G0004180, partial [Takifugu flavidus]